MNVVPESEALLERLCAGADPRKVRSLRLIHAICVEQRERGSDDYSIATIGRLSAERGGPAAGAIRNKPGEASRAHQNLRRLTDTKKPGGRSARTTEVNLILGGISDAVLRGRLGLLAAEFKATRAQLLAARHLANRTATLDMADSPRNELRPPATTRTPAEVRALENAVSPENLQHWG